jgi:hypothetical protein
VGIDVKSKTIFLIHILQEDVRQPVAKVGKKDGKSFHDLFAASTAADGEPSKLIRIAWENCSCTLFLWSARMVVRRWLSPARSDNGCLIN